MGFVKSTIDMNKPKFEIRNSAGSQYHFVLIAENGEIVATSENYVTRSGCENGITAIQRIAADADIIDATE